MNTNHLITLLLLNLPVYILGFMALWRKNRDENYYGAFLFSILLLLLLVEAVAVSQTTYVETATPLFIHLEAITSVFIIPIIYMFHAPEGGQEKFNRTVLFLFLATLILLLPTTTWEVAPGYSIIEDLAPKGLLGISLFYKGKFFYHLTYTSIVLLIQSYIALSRLDKLYKLVMMNGGKYTWKAKMTYYWDFSCGYFLATSFFLPLSFWQTPAMRWTYYIISAVFIGLGCLLVFLGFDLNPVIDHETSGSSSLDDFLLENGELVNSMKQLLEEDKAYLEPGIQSLTVAQRLDTSHAYFLRMMQAVYGCSFPEWVNRQRIEYAKPLLREQKSFEEVASACGFSNTFAFLRMFMRINNGQTASEYCREQGNVAPIYKPQQGYEED